MMLRSVQRFRRVIISFELIILPLFRSFRVLEKK